MVLSANLPFQFVENSEFIELLQIARPTNEIPSRQRLRHLLNQRYDERNPRLLRDLGPSTKVSLAVYCWSSPNRHSFIAVLAYHISEDWKHCEALLGFEHISGPHTGQNIARIVEGVIVQFNLTDHLFAISSDNGSNNATLCRTIEDALQAQDVYWSAEAMKVSCLAHVLNLSAKALLVSLDVTDENGSNETPPELDECSPELIPSTATNDVARTVIRVRIFSPFYTVLLAEICRSFAACRSLSLARLNGLRHFRSYNHHVGS